jgi:3',5'-cyclic AMP phosphodiesterase CpdA
MGYEDFQAFLHIVHISDMHCRRTLGRADPRAEQLARKVADRLRRMNPGVGAAVERQIAMGFGGHDPMAHHALRRFLQWFACHPEYGSIPSWLLDTGDLAAIGDAHSIRSAKRYQGIYRSLLKATASMTIYGNHDAWAETLPVLSSNAEMAQHRDLLRQKFFPSVWPQGPLSIDIPHTSSRLRLFGVNSVIDDRWLNTLALGQVGRDPRWMPRPSGQKRQMPVLEDLVAQDPDARRDFRVLALHHPVHYPPPRPVLSMHLRNDQDVGDALSRFHKRGRGKLASLILSGHTHSVFPAAGTLPADTRRQWYNTLGLGQLQLITGSVAQAASSGARLNGGADPVPHQFEVLTFFASPAGKRQQLVMERRIVGRPLGMAEFGFLPLAGKAGIVEATWFDY